MTTREEVINYLSQLSLCDVEALLSEVKSIDEGFPDGLQPIGGGPIPVYGATFNGAVAYGALNPDDYDYDSFDVFLSKTGDRRIECMKLVRQLTKLELIECKYFVDNPMSKPMASGIGKTEADYIKSSFEKIGAEVAIRGMYSRKWY